MSSSKKFRYKIIERVVLGNTILGYSFPDVISPRDAVALADTIEADKELLAMVTSAEAGINKTIWDKLQKLSQIATSYVERYPTLVNFRISGEYKNHDSIKHKGAYNQQRPDNKDSTTELDRYDAFANLEKGNGKKGQYDTVLPSFKEFFQTTTWRGTEVSGAATKESPVSGKSQQEIPVTTFKQVPPK